MKALSIDVLRFLLISFLSFPLYAQDVVVDDKGVMRWSDTRVEVQGFGVNYTTPFAHAYRQANQMGLDHKTLIDQDVYHFKRLGFDLYRVHVWDVEISDTLGNLLENENLDLFDYLLFKLKENEINYVLTPIAFWGNGWPEPDEETPGFSNRWGKGGCLTEPGCIAAQQNYLAQFANHVNPYTKLAYKDDPGVLAFEISNEPHHRGDPEVVRDFVAGMVEAIKQTGTKKPIFYNTSHGVHFMDDYFQTGIDGGTFQWYPTGLGYQRELPGNVLINVDDYRMPFDTTIQKYGGAKLVYEFDAADVGRAHVYPAMARSFREAGIQIATHFAYDPTFLAPFNTEYNTHYMNLAYTPRKALGLMICSEIFHDIPLREDQGMYPENLVFGNTRIDPEQELAVYSSERKFYYTNSTVQQPNNESKLERIAGYGNSPLVQYNGAGAYFLDKIDKGVWRLEVMPDAAWVANPFGRNSPDQTVGVVQWNTRTMTVKMKDLGSDYTATGINEGNQTAQVANRGSVMLQPGVYMLSRKGVKKKWSASDDFGADQLSTFYAPESQIERSWFQHEEVTEASSGRSLEVSVQYVTRDQQAEIELWVYSGWQPTKIPMRESAPFQYAATIPAEVMKPGFLTYLFVVNEGEKVTTYPANLPKSPNAWDFYTWKTHRIRVAESSYPIRLFNAKVDVEFIVRPWRRGLATKPTADPDEAEFQVNMEKLFVPDNENLNAEPIHDYSFKHFVIDALSARSSDLDNMKNLVFKGRALNDKPCRVQVALTMRDGSSYGKVIEVGPEPGEFRLSLDELELVPTVLLPRPYPTFLPYYFDGGTAQPFDLNKVESVQFSIGPGIQEEELEDPHGFGVIWLELR